MATTLVPVGVDRSLVKARIAELQEQLAAELELLNEPQEPEWVHSVVRFRKWDQAYVYAAIKAYVNAAGEGVWFVTQDGARTPRQGIQPRVWSELLHFIGERNWPQIEVLS